jgi:energy-coupling factor transporter ATP-binding protein EcfA2
MKAFHKPEGRFSVVSSCATESPFVIRVERLSYVPPGGVRRALRNVDLTLNAGECAVLTGPTGCGKSTLLRAIAGVLPAGGHREGRCALAGRSALLFQNVETQLLFTTVAEEVASGPLHAGAAPREVRRRVEAALAQVGLEGFERRAVDALSAGEKQRVVLAALLALDPAILLLDEPTSALDDAARERLARTLGRLRQHGHAIVVADHILGPFRELADRCWTMKEGRLKQLPAVPPEAGALLRPPPSLDDRARDVLRCCDVGVCDASGRELLQAVSFRVRRGERVLLTGPNGSGKTTLLRTIAGLGSPAAGSISRPEPAGGSDSAPAGSIGFLFQNPTRNLFERTVRDEIAFALRRTGRSVAEVRRRVEEVLEQCELGPHGGRSPLRLSFGEQHRVALASALAPEPALLLLDEPFSGLDREARLRLLDAVAREQHRCGCGVLIAVHDERPLVRWAHRRLHLECGRTRDG